MKRIFCFIGILLLGLGIFSQSEAREYVVVKGDSLSSISCRELGLIRKMGEIKRYENGQAVNIADKNKIFVGERLWIPEPEDNKVAVSNIAAELSRDNREQEVSANQNLQPITITNPDDFNRILIPGVDFIPPRERKVYDLGRGYGISIRDPEDMIDTLNADLSVHTPLPGESKERNGWNAKGKFKPRFFRLEKQGADGSWRFGPYVEAQIGHTEAVRESGGRQSDSNYHGVGGGISTEYKTFDTETDFDLGVSYQHTQNTTPVKNFESNQMDVTLDAEARYKNENRRLVQGKRLFPYYEFFARYTHPLSADYSDSTGKEGEEYSYSPQEAQVGGKIGIYDFRLDKNGFFYLTPTFNLLFGKSWGKGSYFIKGGPGIDGRAFGQDIITANFLNPKYFFSGDGGRFYPFEVSLKVDDVVRAVQAYNMIPDNTDNKGKIQQISVAQMSEDEMLAQAEPVYFGAGYDRGV